MEPSKDYLELEVEGSDRIATRIARKYAKEYSVRHLYERQSRYILKCLQGNDVGRLLDLGCGIGNFLVHAQHHFTNLHGVDPGPESLEVAKTLVPDADLRIGCGERLPYHDHHFDAIVMKGVVHHLEDPVVVFREVYRCLTPGGVLVIFEGNRSSVFRRIVLRLADSIHYEHETTLFEHRAPGVMKGMLEEAQLEPIVSRNISGFFAPLALLGVGGPRTWRLLDTLEDMFQATVPWLFNYYVLLAARKT